jgi:EmrB/QacA subfamily drug resistance transporter
LSIDLGLDAVGTGTVDRNSLQMEVRHLMSARQPHGTRSAGGHAGALVLLCAAQLLVVLDLSVVNVALPSIQRDLGAGTATLQWVISGYALTFGGFLMVGGRAADLFGRRRVFMAGLAVFTFASLLGGLAPNAEVLIGARALQGVAAAAASPAALSLITTIFTDDAGRRRALSVFAAAGSAAFAVGVVLGGVLTDVLNWRWVLFINVPIGVLALVLAPAWLPERRDPRARRLDLPGAATVTAAFLALIYGLSRAEAVGWARSDTVGPLAAAVLLLAGFVVIERRAADPLAPPRLFRLRSTAGANAVMFLVSAAFFPMFLLVSQYVQEVLGLSVFAAGLAFVPMALTVTVCSGYLSAKLTAAYGPRPVVTAGTATMAIGLFLLTRSSPTGTYLLDVLPASLVVALGIGTSFTAVIMAATARVPEGDQGAASGLISTSQQVGGAVGVAALVALATTSTAASPPSVALVAGYRAAFAASTAVVLAAALIAWFTLRDDASAPDGPAGGQSTGAPPNPEGSPVRTESEQA